VFSLTILLLFCHFLADFSHLIRPEMLKAKMNGTPLLPILYHAIVHGVLMFVVLAFFTEMQIVILLTIIEIISHFVIDVWKGKMNVWFPEYSSPTKQEYWYIFGFDQFLHQAVIIYMVWWIYG
jgi:hypothetical protein